MNRIIFVLILLSSIIVYGQANIPVTKGSVDFYADSLSQTITLDKSVFLGGLYMVKSRTALLTFQVYNTEDAAWYNLTDDGSAYSVAVDSTVNVYVPLKPIVFYPVKKLRILLDNDIADTLSLIYDKRPY